MHITKRRGLALVAVAALAGSATTAISASGHGDKARGHHGLRHQTPMGLRHHAVPLLVTSVAPSVPTDPKLFGVAPGGAPWKLKFGVATVLRNGRVVVALKGLLITGTNTANDNTVGPVTAVDAALYCGDKAPAAATTPSVPLSAQGNALINAKVTLPAKCLAPALVVNPTVNGAAVPGTYIAASGFGA